MTTDLTPKQPYEEYAISFNFTAVLGVETVASATITAIDRLSLADVSLVVLDVTKQSITTPIVFAWVRAGTSGHEYVITCKIVGSAGSLYELDGILPVTETPDTGTATAGNPVVAPLIEPVSLQELKNHLRLDSGDFSDNLTTTQSIAPGSHAIADNYTVHVGAYSDVLGLSAVVILDSGTNAATGKVDVKIQESDDHSAWTDWTGGAFTQVTTATDNAVYEKAYTGSKQYIRTVAKVLLAACEFGTQIHTYSSDATDDDILSAIITAARMQVETITGRQLITATWDMFLNDFPSKEYIEIPYGNLQSITSIKYTDCNGTLTTMTATTDYLVDLSSDPGRVVLPYAKSWPSLTLYPVNPIAIRFVCGYGSLASDVPQGIRTAIKMMAADLYENRETQGTQQMYQNKAAESLLYPYRLWKF